MGILFHFEVKMAVNNGAFLPFLVLSTILVLFSNQYRTTAIDEKGKPLITSTCNSTDFPNDCVTFLESDPRTSTVDQKNYNKTFEILDGVIKATLRCKSLSR